MSYNEFVKMVDDGKVESIKRGKLRRFHVHPKEGNPKYSQQIWSIMWCGWRGTTSLWTGFWKIMWLHSGR